MQSQYQSRQLQHTNQFQQQFYRYSPSHQRNSMNHLQGLSRSRNESLVMMQNNQRNMSIANYTINNMMSPNFGDENRLFAFYSPSNRDLMSPQGVNNQSNSQIFHYMGQSVNNRNNNSHNIMQQYAQQYEDQQQQNQAINSMRSQINNPLQNQENPINPIKKSSVSDKKLEEIEERLKQYSSIVMKQTFFNHLSLQIFFILMLILILYSMQYILVLVFLWIVDIISFVFSFKRSKIEQEVDESKQEEHSNIWRFVETTFSIVFKICLYIYLEVSQYKFYYVPCTLLIYVLIRFFFVISKKLAENGPISALINECFTWGFKIFFVGQVFLISVRMNNKIDWSWQDVFWPYWVFFYIMIGTNSVFVILLLSKILLKCLGQPVQSFEIKGLFWFFLLSNGLCVNSTLFVRGAVTRLDHQSIDDAQLAFKYSLVFTSFFIIYTLFFWKGIWVFMLHFSQEREDTEGDENSQKNTSRINKSKRRKNKNKANEGNQQDQQQNQDGQKSNNENQREKEGEDDEEDEEEEEEDDDDDEENRQRNPDDIYAEDENYPAEQQYPESQSNRQNQGRMRNNQANISQQISNQQGQNNQNGVPADQSKTKPKKKIFKKVNLNNKNSQKKGFPLFLEKLSSTYFTALTNNVMKSKREKDQQKKELPSTLNKLTRANTQLDKLDKRSTSQIDMDKSKDCKEEVNKSDLQVNKKKKKGKPNVNSKIDSPKGLSDSMGPVDISFNEKSKTNAAQFQKSQNPLQNLAYETQLKFSELISSPKGQELKKKEFEKKMQQQSNKELAKLTVKPKEIFKKQKSDTSQISQKSCKENGDESNANCVICFENEPDTVYLPCGHGGICYECGMDVMKKTGECYLCRHEIKQVVQIDFKSTDAQKKIIAITAALEEKIDIDADKSIINASQINGQNSDITDRSVTITQNQIENNVSQSNISQQNTRQIQQISQQQQTQNNQQSGQNNSNQQQNNQQQIQQVQPQLQQQIQQQQEPLIRNNQGIAFFDYNSQQQLPLQSPHFNLALQSPNFNNIQQLPEQIQEQINNNNNVENINDVHIEFNDQNNQQHQQPSQVAFINNLQVSSISMLQRNNSMNSNSFDFVIMRREKSSQGNNKEQNYEENQEHNQNLEESLNNNLQQGTNLRGTNNNFLINFSQDLDKSNEEDQ